MDFDGILILAVIIDDYLMRFSTMTTTTIIRFFNFFRNDLLKILKKIDDINYENKRTKPKKCVDAEFSINHAPK